MTLQLLLCINAPGSGSKWLRDIMGTHPDLYRDNHNHGGSFMLTYGGTTVSDELQNNNDLDNVKDGKCWFWIPHGMMIMGAILKKAKEKNAEYKIIHLIRDGRNVIGTGINRGYLPELWNNYVREGLKYRGDNYYEIYYENLCKNFKEELKKLCDFCEITCPENWLNSVEKPKPDSNNFSKLNLSNQQEIEDKLKDLLIELNYDLNIKRY